MSTSFREMQHHRSGSSGSSDGGGRNEGRSGRGEGARGSGAGEQALDEKKEGGASVRGEEAVTVKQEEHAESSSTRQSSPLSSADSAYAFPSPGDVFETKQEFFEACALAIEASSDYTGYKLTSNDCTIASACRARSDLKCPLKSTATLEDEGWVVDGGRSTFEHDHDNVSSTSSPRQQVGALAEVQPAAASRVVPTATGIAPIISGAPKVGDVFSSPDAALKYYVDTVVPIMGISVSRVSTSDYNPRFACNRRAGQNPACRYHINLVRKGHQWAVDGASHLQHNHGPSPQILQDPSWRPFTRSSSRRPRPKRAASSSGDESDSSGCSSGESDGCNKEGSTSVGGGQQEGQLRRSAPSASVEVIVKRPASPFAPMKKQRVAESYLAPTSSMIRPPQLDYTNRRLSAPLPTPFTTRPLTFQSTSSIPTATRSTMSTPLFLSSLSTFIASIHPPLATSANILYEAGIKDQSLLIAFVGMSDRARDSILRDTNLPRLARHLLSKKLKEASSAGRTSRA